MPEISTKSILGNTFWPDKSFLLISSSSHPCNFFLFSVDLSFYFLAILRYEQKQVVCSSSSDIDFRASVDVSHSQLSNDNAHTRNLSYCGIVKTANVFHGYRWTMDVERLLD